MFSCEFCEISKNIISYRTPVVAASDTSLYLCSAYLPSFFNLSPECKIFCYEFPPCFYFIMPVALPFPTGSCLFSSFEYPLDQTLYLLLLLCLCKNLLSPSHTQLRSVSI